MTSPHVRTIVIAGGGTAGWMTAAALSKVLGADYTIRLVESEQIGTIGVGEATIPLIREYNRALGIDEDEFLRATQGTFKLGVEFRNWGALGDRYIHGFGTIGQPLDAIPFHHYWMRMAAEGKASDLRNYSINTAAPLQQKFMRARPDMANSPLGHIVHAFHFDAGLYARFLRKYSEQRGVERIEGKVVRVLQREPDGFIDALQMENGDLIKGDLFIDCSGMRAMLIGQALGVPFEDYSHWLPNDRALAVPCEAAPGDLVPVTRATAHKAGWQWRIPLQSRIGNGHVYSSRFMGDDEAASILMNNLEGKPLGEPRPISFKPGRRVRGWDRNCVAVGLAAGFFEPIESTTIHMVQTSIARLISMFPRAGFEQADIDEYNAQSAIEYATTRDFIILHFKATRRNDSPFWDYCREMSIPESLQHRIELYRSNGRIFRKNEELFAEVSWLQVMHGQHIQAGGYHPLADKHSSEQVKAYLDDIERVVGKCVDAMPTHADFIAANCAA
ncbi:MAG TPA: tryptophan halogenase family protein [Telluria sp.]|nr:tryptophan halogenase family protein [Telluria sp.]